MLKSVDQSSSWRLRNIRIWIRKNAATIGAVMGAATLFTTIAGLLLYLLVTQPIDHRFDAIERHLQIADTPSP